MSGSGSKAQWEQLPMLMTAQEVQTTLKPADYRPMQHGATHEGLWNSKRAEAEKDSYWYDDRTYDGGSLAESIREEGIKTPVNIYHDDHPFDNYRTGEHMLRNGHHRVAVAASIDPNYLIPVAHSDATEHMGAVKKDLDRYRRRHG